MLFSDPKDDGRPGTFSHGIHPEDYKSFTCELPIERMEFVPEYVIPLSQHIGAPAVAEVEKGKKCNGETGSPHREVMYRWLITRRSVVL